MRVKKGDQVLVIAGNDKGKRGEVLSVFRDEDRVVVEGINVRWKHERRSEQRPKGERVQREFPIHASNVMIIDPSTGKATRKRPKG